MRAGRTCIIGFFVSGSISRTSLVVLGHLVGEFASSTVTSLYWRKTESCRNFLLKMKFKKKNVDTTNVRKERDFGLIFRVNCQR